MKKLIRFCFVNVMAMTLSAIAYGQSYTIVGTNQTNYYNNTTTITAPSVGQSFYGQDAHYPGNVPSYTDNGDGTVTDNLTGLMWEQTVDKTGDGTINYYDKMTYAQALAGASSCNTGGYNDWRLPTIKELYSLAMFSGAEIDPMATSPGTSVPFFNTVHFEVGYGDLSASSHGALANNRIIDGQMASSTLYVSTTMGGSVTMFGFNPIDGRIKGYPTIASVPEDGQTKRFYILYVRGNTSYGVNDFVNNGNGTITDNSTGLMWLRDDNGTGLNWEDALSYAENFQFAGYTDWRLPDAKELQSIVDYTRSPATTGSAAINPIFNCTQIINEAGNADYPCYWSNSTFSSLTPTNGTHACYFSFGRAMGYMSFLGGWIDVHGAGCQRSDPKAGNPANYPTGFAPQGDAVRIYNYVRLVRDAGNTTGMNKIKPELNMKIYPNPANEIISVNLATINKMNDLLIYNQLGEAIYYENIYSKNEIRIDVSDFSTGIYLVRITDGNKAYSDKFIVQ